MSTEQTFMQFAKETLIRLLQEKKDVKHYVPMQMVEKLREIDFSEHVHKLNVWHINMIYFLDFMMEQGADDLTIYKDKNLLLTEMLCQTCGYLLTELCPLASESYADDIHVSSLYFENLINKVANYNTLLFI